MSFEADYRETRHYSPSFFLFSSKITREFYRSESLTRETLSKWTVSMYFTMIREREREREMNSRASIDGG